MPWIPAIAWLAAIVVAVVVLGFCAYELRWKSARLRTDLDSLQRLGGQVAALQADLAAAQERARAARIGSN